jgi:hypothetical protein
MPHDPQHEIWNPFRERVDGLTAEQRIQIEKSEAWALFYNGGGGDPAYFDHERWLKMQARSR